MTFSSRKLATTLATILLTTAFVGASDQASAAITGMKSADIKFAGPPETGERAGLHGDMAKADLISVRIKRGKCNINPPRSFPYDLHVTILSGNMSVGEGDKLDKTKATAYGAGDFYFVPANTVFFDWATEDTVLQASFVGPRKVTFANPADEEASKKPEFHKCP